MTFSAVQSQTFTIVITTDEDVAYVNMRQPLGSEDLSATKQASGAAQANILQQNVPVVSSTT